MRNLFFILICCILFSCKREKIEPFDLITPNYPLNIGGIITTKCAVTGCHNSKSNEAAAGLSLSTWTEMMQGSRNGSIVIPNRADMSTLFLFTNTYKHLGAISYPTMPVNGDKLTEDEVVQIKNWINQGAYNLNGEFYYFDYQQRKKFYVTNQGCDLLAILDANSLKIMKYIDLGKNNEIESPHKIVLTPDNSKYAICFLNSSILEIRSSNNDALLAQTEIGNGNWNTISITPNGKYAFVVDWSANGKIAVVDMETFQLKITYQGNNLFSFPHGSKVSPDGKHLYILAQTGNFYYKINIENVMFPEIEELILEPQQPKTVNSRLDPHQMVFDTRNGNYYITCQGSNELRAYNSNDEFLWTVNIGVYPQELVLDKSRNKIYVTCMEDRVNFSGKIGSVSIVNIQTQSLETHLFSGYQPHGLALNESAGKLLIANRNISQEGPAPHHTTQCAGRNGYITIIDVNQNKVMNGSKLELSVDPYGATFKP